MYFKVPVIAGILDMDYKYLLKAIQITTTEAYVCVREGVEIRDSWQSITEEEWLNVQPPEPLPQTPETTEQKLARLEEQNLILMDALATTFEELLELRAIVEGGTGA